MKKRSRITALIVLLIMIVPSLTGCISGGYADQINNTMDELGVRDDVEQVIKTLKEADINEIIEYIEYVYEQDKKEKAEIREQIESIMREVQKGDPTYLDKRNEELLKYDWESLKPKKSSIVSQYLKEGSKSIISETPIGEEELPGTEAPASEEPEANELVGENAPTDHEQP